MRDLFLGWDNIDINRSDSECKRCLYQTFKNENIARKISKDRVQAVFSCQRCGKIVIIIEGIWLHPEVNIIERSEVQESFLSELRELMNNYGVELHKWDEDSYHFITNDLENNDENYICINIDNI